MKTCATLSTGNKNHSIEGPNACIICGNFPLWAYLKPEHELLTLREFVALRHEEGKTEDT